MSGFDILIDKELENLDIQNFFAEIFKLSVTEVIVVEDIVSPHADAKCEIFCVKHKLGGMFSLCLELFISNNLKANIDDREIIGQLSDKLDCKCLISDDSINPFTFILVTGVSKYYAVSIEPDGLDIGEYNIVEYKDKIELLSVVASKNKDDDKCD